MGGGAMGATGRGLARVAAPPGEKHRVAGNHDRCWSGHGRRATRWVPRYREAGFVEIVSEVARDLVQDQRFASMILEPLEVLGVDAFKATEVTLRFRIKTLPMKQWEVGRELRRRIKKAFDAKGVPVPGTQLTVPSQQ